MTLCYDPTYSETVQTTFGIEIGYRDDQLIGKFAVAPVKQFTIEIIADRTTIASVFVWNGILFSLDEQHPGF